MHSLLTKTLFRPIGSLCSTSMSINICARMNNYVFADKLARTSVLTVKPSRVESVLINQLQFNNVFVHTNLAV